MTVDDDVTSFDGCDTRNLVTVIGCPDGYMTRSKCSVIEVNRIQITWLR